MADFKGNILHLSMDEVDSIVPLLEGSAYKPLRYLAKDLGTYLTDAWFHSITDLLRTPASHGLLAIQDGEPKGLLIYSDNPWEMDLFKKRAATINTFVVDSLSPNRSQVALSLLDYALLNAAENGVQFMLSKTYADDITIIHALESRGFLLMDTIADCYFDYRKTPLESLTRPLLAEGVSIRLASAADRNELVEVAGQAFRQHFGRFHADERIGRQVAIRVYKQWMCSSLDGYADWIHLALVAEKIVGFSIWKRPSPTESQLKVRVGHYSIAGIHPDFQGRDLFTALTYAGMQSLEGIADIIEGPTHVNNYGVQVGYLKMGWHVLSDARHSFHKWMD
jgi:hypothetical protein